MTFSTKQGVVYLAISQNCNFIVFQLKQLLCLCSLYHIKAAGSIYMMQDEAEGYTLS